MSRSPGRLQWLCRRGMKELDVLLEKFLTVQSSELMQGQWPEFESLLSAEDDQLWDWIQQPGSCPESAWQPLLNAIRKNQ